MHLLPMYLLLMSLLWRKMHKDGGVASLPHPILVHSRPKDRIETRASPAKGRLIGARICAVQVRGFASVVWSFWYRYRKRVPALPASLVPSYCPFFFAEIRLGSSAGGRTGCGSLRSPHRWCLSSVQKKWMPQQVVPLLLG